MSFKTIFAGIIGPPNVGKSTLMNQILGTKLAIVSPKPQTTRTRIIGIFQGKGYQIVFVDTPGIHKTHSPLHKSMVASAHAVFHEVDIILFMMDVRKPGNSETMEILNEIKRIRKPGILLINKIDSVSRSRLLPIIDEFRQKYAFEAIIPISALKGDGIDRIIDELKRRLKPGPRFYPTGMHSDQPESILIAEILREKIFHQTKKELPYASAVTVEKVQKNEEMGTMVVIAKIHVETDSQKRILIGKKGQLIKGIGRAARVELEEKYHMKVFLDLTVRVEKKWSKDTKALRRLGY